MATANQLAQFLSALNAHDIARMRELLAPEFFGYQAKDAEPTAPEAWGNILAAITAAFPDFSLEAQEPAETDDEARAGVVARGTFTGNLWGVQGNGRNVAINATAVARAIGDRIAVRWDDVQLVPTLRTLGIAPMPEQAHLPGPARPPELVLRLAFNGMRLAEKECRHLDMIKVTEPKVTVCEQCASTNTVYPALRMCLTCGAVGCCDLSINKHMKAHAESERHPLVRSIVEGESWLWCYEDSAFLGSRHLANR